MARLASIWSAALGFSLAVANPWGSETSREFAKKAYALQSRGDFAGAQQIYEEGYRHAVSSANTKAQIRFLNSIGAAHNAQFQFQSAQRVLLEARHLAEKHADQAEEHGAILFNLASVYLATSNVDAADEAAREGSRLLEGRKPTYYQARLHLIRAVIAANQERWAESTFHYGQAIEAADKAGDDAALALILNRSATTNLAAGLVDVAERQFLEAFRLRRLRRDPDMLYTLVGLSELDLAQGRIHEALRLADNAERLAEHSHHPVHRHVIHGLRARILFRQGKYANAHREFMNAFDSIRRSRADVLPADMFRLGSEASLERLYDGAIRNALLWRKFDSGAPSDLAVQVWLAAEEWKASVASHPRQVRDLASDRLGPDYWRTLNEYRTLERASFSRAGASASADDRLPQLRLRLAEMESFAGIRPFSTIFPENFPPRKALFTFRDSLEPDTVLIRYHLGQQDSVRWVLTRRGLDWKQLKITPKELEALAGRFNRAVRESSNIQEIRQLGRKLYEELFGDLPLEARAASHWLLALDGVLFQLPLAALSEADPKTGRLRYLVERHSVEIVTGAQALLAKPTAGKGSGEFVGIGDAIYNPADPRVGGAKRPALRAFGALFASEQSGAEGRIHLPRLASSQLELRSSAAAWNGPAKLLIGKDADRQSAVRSIEAGAAVVHFATHFLQNEESPDRALLVLSLDAQGLPDFFTPSDAMHVKTPESLVVLSGCQSAAGRLVPVAGLIGMARAWLMAGASGVVASLWPVPDDNGAIFQAFYSKLRRNGGSSINGDGDFNTRVSVRPRGGIVRKAAEALRYAQLEMLRTNSWRAMPKYWGTYQLVGRMT